MWEFGSSKEKKGLPGREGAAQAGWAPLLVSALGGTPSNGLARLARDLGTLTMASPEPHRGPGTETRLLLCCPAHPMVLLGTGRAHPGCSPCRSLTMPVSPSLVWKTLASPPARAMQMEKDKYKLLCPHCPCPGSRSISAGQDTPAQAARTLPLLRNGSTGETGSTARRRRRRGRL